MQWSDQFHRNRVGESIEFVCHWGALQSIGRKKRARLVSPDQDSRSSSPFVISVILVAATALHSVIIMQLHYTVSVIARK